jgi:hypothetical protein
MYGSQPRKRTTPEYLFTSPRSTRDTQSAKINLEKDKHKHEIPMIPSTQLSILASLGCTSQPGTRCTDPVSQVII